MFTEYTSTNSYLHIQYTHYFQYQFTLTYISTICTVFTLAHTPVRLCGIRLLDVHSSTHATEELHIRNVCGEYQSDPAGLSIHLQYVFFFFTIPIEP